MVGALRVLEQLKGSYTHSIERMLEQIVDVMLSDIIHIGIIEDISIVHK
jgi:hypothetical protein